jgi:hypothetical protein
MTDTSASSTTPSPAPETTTTPAAAPASAPWYNGFAPDLKGYIETKGFPGDEKGVAALADSYRNLEKHFGVPAEQLLKLPKDETDKAAWDKIHERLGRPAKPEEYELALPNGDNGEYAKFISTAMHELGLTKKQAQALALKQNEFITAQESKDAEAYQATIKTQDAGLRATWGQAYDKNMQIAKGAFAELGVTTEVVDAMEEKMGYSKVMETFHRVGLKIGEDKFVTANGANGFNGAMSPAAAQARIDAIRTDPALANRYVNGDAALRAEMDNLHRMLVPVA